MVDVPRYEVNRQVRVVLNRHDIDVTRVDYSSIGGTVYLSGDLFKNSDSDLVPAAIESLMRDITGISGVRDVQTDFQNWFISNSCGAWQITKGKKRSHDIGALVSQQGGQADAAQETHIEKSEKIADVLKEMGEESGQKKR